MKTDEALSILLMNGASPARKFGRATSMFVDCAFWLESRCEFKQRNGRADPERKRHRVKGDADRNTVDQPVIFRVHRVLLLSGVRSMCLFSPPFSHLWVYTDEA